MPPCPRSAARGNGSLVLGNGGQRLWLMPEAEIAIVIFSGNYDAPDAWITPNRACREIVAANLQRA